jgi:hypothetical protein
MDTKYPNQVFYVWLIYQQAICAKYELETWISLNEDIRKYFLDMKHGWTKNAFWVVKKKEVNVIFFHLSYLIKLMAYLCARTAPNTQIKYFKFYWSINRLLVLNRGWKHDFLQIMIFVYICSTWSIVEPKSRFETWITTNDVNGVSLFNIYYLIILMTYHCSQRTPNV